MSFNFAALERRIAALEQNRGASLRFAKVTEVKGGFVRVQMPDGEDVVSYELPTVQPRVLKDQDIKMPDVGEPVACLFRGQGFEEGIVLGACYSPETPDPEQEAHFAYHKYKDGTELWYDREEHKLVAKVEGHIKNDTKNTITAKAKEDIVVESETQITLKVGDSTIVMTPDGITLNAPIININ